MFAQSVPLNGQWIAYLRAGTPTINDNQCYLPKNVSINNSCLQLTTKLESCGCTSIDEPPDQPWVIHNYSSAQVAMGTFNFLYGTIEARIQFGGGTNSGAWSAIWMLDSGCQPSDPTGTDDRCAGQEIDIAETWGDYTQVNQQIHVNGNLHNDGGKVSPGFDVSAGFHVYQCVWSAGSLLFNIDGVTTTTITQAYVPSTPMYVKINTNVAGPGTIVGGSVNNGTLPWTMLVDYVKVTQAGVTVFFDDFLG